TSAKLGESFDVNCPAPSQSAAIQPAGQPSTPATVASSAMSDVEGFGRVDGLEPRGKVEARCAGARGNDMLDGGHRKTNAASKRLSLSQTGGKKGRKKITRAVGDIR